MELSQWFAQHGFTLLQSTGIIAGLLFNALAFRADAKSRRVTNFITVTAHHREIWSRFAAQPELFRVLDPNADLNVTPITREEELFTRDLILHLSSAHQAMRDGWLMKWEGLPRDVRWFFSLPIPKAVWERLKPLQNREFVRFVDVLRAGERPRPRPPRWRC